MQKEYGDELARDVDTRIHAFFPTIAALLAMAPFEFEDGQLVTVKGTAESFIWKAASRAKPTTSSILAPTANSFNAETTAGRFHKVGGVDGFEFANTAAASAVGLMAALATVLTPVTYTLLAGGLTELGKAARQIVMTVAGGTPAQRPLTALVTGFDSMGNVQSETVALPATATTVTTVNYYVNTGLVISSPAASGTAATVSIGWGAKLGLPRPIRMRQSTPMVLAEYALGLLVTTGTFTGPAADAPNGSYTPAHALDGAADFVVIAEVAA